VVTFDKLFAISDLHIGGTAGRRAFREGNELAWLIQHITTDQPTLRVGLLLNGDIFDFLADDDAKEFSSDADRIIRALAGDPELAPIFTALGSLVASQTRVLIVQIGNHDIELALPNAQRAFLECINASNPPAIDRVRFEASGRGWPCKVAGRSVLAVHGNASDPWNAIDQRGLRAAAAAQQAGDTPIPEPDANAGTTLVVRVMNQIKRRFPVVDLFKPEGAPLMSVLAAVDAPTSALGLLRAVGRIRAQRGTLTDLLAAGDAGLDIFEGPPKDIVDFLESLEPPTSAAEDRLQRAEENLRARRSPRDLVEDDSAQLGSLTEVATTRLHLISSWFKDKVGQPRLTSLRLALARWLRDDETFDPRQASAIDKRIVGSASPGIEVVIAGHTHLPRELKDNGVIYLNTGTWMRILKLHGSSYLRSDAEFEPFFAAVTTGNLSDIDNLSLDPRQRPVAVVDETTARLFSVAAERKLVELLPGGGP